MPHPHPHARTDRRRSRRILALACLATALTAGCSRGRAGESAEGLAPCGHAQRVAWLPRILHETSGLAASRRHAGVLWTHDDSGGEPVVYAIDARGHLLGSVRVTGARNADWEDIALGPCASGDCLYIGDIGDNSARRPAVEIYRVPEPAPGDTATAPAERISVTYPDGPRDAEALYVLPDTSIYVVSKGRKSAVSVYRVPRWAPGTSAALERVQELSRSGSEDFGLVTGADASGDGALVAIRTYETVRLYRSGTAGRLTPVLPEPGASLADAHEPQGEAVAFGRGDTIWLSTEAGYRGTHAALGRIECRLQAARRP